MSAPTGTDAQLIDPRLGCSTISFRSLSLPEALAEVAAQGFEETDLGALPGICNHVPTPLPSSMVDTLAEQVTHTGVAVRVINADVGDLDDPTLDRNELQRRLETLIALAHAVGTTTIMLPCGSQEPDDDRHGESAIQTLALSLHTAAELLVDAGLQMAVEAPHARRLCADLDRSEQLFDLLEDAPVGAVLDLSHVVAGGGDTIDAVHRLGPRLQHVHLRDAVPGDLNRSIGRGQIDFAAAINALESAGYRGHYSLELETHDIDDADRPAEAGRAGRFISRLLRSAQGPASA